MSNRVRVLCSRLTGSDEPPAPSGALGPERAGRRLHLRARELVERAGAAAHGICGGVIAEEMGLGKTLSVITFLHTALSRARDEIELALSARCFEQSVVNEEIETAYSELKAIVLGALRQD